MGVCAGSGRQAGLLPMHVHPRRWARVLERQEEVGTLALLQHDLRTTPPPRRRRNRLSVRIVGSLGMPGPRGIPPPLFV